MRNRRIFRREIIGGFGGNIFTSFIEAVAGIARKVAPVAFDASKAFDTGAASAAGTAFGQKIADKIKCQPTAVAQPIAQPVAIPVPTTTEIREAVNEVAPNKERAAAMIKITKKLLSPQGEDILRKLK